jgi:hypothetical protein
VQPKHGLLVGPGAAGILGWDGFSPSDPTSWLVPHHTGTSSPGVIRSRLWTPSNGPTAEPLLVLAYLLEGITSLARMPDDRAPISAIDRFELAYEHYLRNGGIAPRRTPGRCTKSIALARDLDRNRGEGEPPTESFLETRAVQRVREFGYRRVFRQLPLLDSRGRILNRIDIVVPFNPRAKRPHCFTSDVGVPVEGDGRRFHELSFEKDRKRHNNFVVAGANSLVVTNTTIELQSGTIRTQLRKLLGY